MTQRGNVTYLKLWARHPLLRFNKANENIPFLEPHNAKQIHEKLFSFCNLNGRDYMKRNEFYIV